MTLGGIEKSLTNEGHRNEYTEVEVQLHSFLTSALDEDEW